MFFSAPEDASNRDKYLIGTAATLQGIGKYLHDVVYGNNSLDWEEEVKKIGEIDWSHQSSLYGNMGEVTFQKKGNLSSLVQVVVLTVYMNH